MRQQILHWILTRLGANPFILGLNAPQGAGKSTLSKWLCEELAKQHIHAVTVSIDDFYFTRAEQVQLAKLHSQNPYLQQRGYPGTHDVTFGSSTLNALKNLGESAVTIPRYDKSAFQGQGDRAPMESWPRVRGPLRLIILEGWMLGFRPVGPKNLPNSYFDEIDRRLGGYQEWLGYLDGFLQLKPNDYRHVLKWRVEAEEKMKASGKAGLSLADIQHYVELFLPAYETYLPTLEEGPIVGRNRLTVPVGIERLPQ